MTASLLFRRNGGTPASISNPRTPRVMLPHVPSPPRPSSAREPGISGAEHLPVSVRLEVDCEGLADAEVSQVRGLPTRPRPARLAAFGRFPIAVHRPQACAASSAEPPGRRSRCAGDRSGPHPVISVHVLAADVAPGEEQRRWPRPRRRSEDDVRCLAARRPGLRMKLRPESLIPGQSSPTPSAPPSGPSRRRGRRYTTAMPRGPSSSTRSYCLCPVFPGTGLSANPEGKSFSPPLPPAPLPLSHAAPVAAPAAVPPSQYSSIHPTPGAARTQLGDQVPCGELEFAQY